MTTIKLWSLRLFLLLALAGGGRPSHALVTLNLKTDCGAVGDGTTDDTAAFQTAASLLQGSGGGTLNIPAGTYIVGNQTTHPNPVGSPPMHPYYQGGPIFQVTGLSSLTINGTYNSTVGNTSIIRTKSGLRWGSFDPYTGLASDNGPWFADPNYAAGFGNVFYIINSSNININHINLDGNSWQLNGGGRWGSDGIEVPGGYGLLFESCSNATLTYVDCSYQALDGICIKYDGLTASHADTPFYLNNCSFQWNGRNALSWVGGIGLYATSCVFNRSANIVATNGTHIFSSPGAGADIEAENAVTRKGSFTYCNFIDNGGPGMTCGGTGDGGYTTFTGCTFWGTTNKSIVSERPGLKYVNCQIYGSALDVYGSSTAALATSFSNCAFEDKPFTSSPHNGLVYNGGYLLNTDANAQNVAFDTCSFTANNMYSLWMGYTGGTFTGCTFTHKWLADPDQNFQCLLRGATLSGCHFKESFPGGTTKTWYVNLQNTTIATGTATTIDGPRVHWRWNTDPIVSPIAAGTYSSPG